MKYCSHCGKEVLDDAIICPGCGCSVQYNNMNNGAPQNQVPPIVDNYSALSVAGLILAFFQPLVGLILSILGHNEAKRTGSAKSLSLSKAGMIISAVILGIAAVIVIIYIILICISLSYWII